MDAWIFDAVRTPRGRARPDGALAGVRAVELVGQLLAALAERGTDPEAVGDLVLGCNTQTGDQGANVAKTAALWAGWPASVAGMTVGSFCTSGLDAIAAAAARVAAGIDEVVVAGGVESMSRVPMLSDRGAWFADDEVAARTGFVHMGVAADLCATRAGFRRGELDAVALRSHHRAAAARDAGWFAPSLVAVRDPHGAALLDRDEGIRDGLTADRLAAFEPAFAELGAMGADTVCKERAGVDVEHLHTIATSPQMVDGASAVVVATRAAGAAMGLRPRARVAAVANVSVDPLSLTGTIEATTKVLARAGMAVADVDRFEANESFAGPVLAYQRALEIDDERINLCGGAIALGHPLGATGGILTATLLDSLERDDLATGVVTIPAGAGLAAALVLTRP